MFVQPMHSRFPNPPGSIAYQHIVQDQPGQCMEGVAPGRHRGRHSEAEPGFSQQAPGSFVAPSSEIQICAENDQLIRQARNEVASLRLSSGRSEPLVPGWSSRIEMCADQAYPAARQSHRRGYCNPALQDQWQLDRLRVFQWK